MNSDQAEAKLSVSPPISSALLTDVGRKKAAPPLAAPRISWVGVYQPMSRKARLTLMCLSFILPIGAWALVSYAPFIWHPLVQITDPGGSSWLQPDMRVPTATFKSEVAAAQLARLARPQGVPANPIYLPAPHEVAVALWAQLSTSPRDVAQGVWLPSNLWHSIQIIFWGFAISSFVGVPLGVVIGSQPVVARLTEPFLDFVRYMPAPAFGALMVAVLGIYDGPKIAIIVIGVFFNQVLVIANVTRNVDPLLVEAALTMGSRNLRLIRKVIFPASLPQIYKAQRILLGSAWTYLIIAELIGESSGVTFFISQQARFQHFDNVFAGILIIGIMGILTDTTLSRIGKRLFPYAQSKA